MTIKVKKSAISAGLFFLVVLSMQGFAQLIPNSLYIIPGIFRYSDLGILVSVIFFIWSYFGAINRKRVKYAFSAYILTFLMIIVISSAMSNHFWGQSVFLGLRTQRTLITCLLLYFPVTHLLKTGRLSYKQFIRLLYIVATLELIVYTLQFFLADIASFTYIDTTEVRYNSARLRVPYLLPLILGIRCLSNVLTGKARTFQKAIWNIIYFLWAAFLLVCICKHRAPSLILVCTMGLAYIIWKKKLTIKMLAGAAVSVILLLIILNSPLIKQMFSSTMQVLFYNSNEGNTLEIRELGQAYYLQKLTKSPLFGFGRPNFNNKKAYKATGLEYGFYLSDNGVTGFMYIHGIVGVIWLVLLFLKVYKMSWGLYKKRISYTFILYFFFETANLYIGMHWFYGSPFPFVMALVMLEYEHGCYLPESVKRKNRKAYFQRRVRWKVSIDQ